MLTYTVLDPIAFALGPIRVHWYGVMYLIAFIGGWWLGRIRAAVPGSHWKVQEIDDLLVYMALGVVLGGRVGYVLFYDFSNLLDDPLLLFRIWQGGMSFHGGLLGVMVAMFLFASRFKRKFFDCTDFVAPLVPLGLGAGRLGNFINGELWGGPTALPWGMRISCGNFPEICFDKLQLTTGAQFTPALHPSQLYEALLEGLVLFILVWLFSFRKRPTMAVSGVFLIGYGLVRIAVEFVRLPDVQIGYLAFDWFTMGQLLSTPMLLGGVGLLVIAYARGRSDRKMGLQ